MLVGAAPAVEVEEAAAVEPLEAAVPVAEAETEAEEAAEVVEESDVERSEGSRVPHVSAMLVVQLACSWASFSYSSMHSL